MTRRFCRLLALVLALTLASSATAALAASGMVLFMRDTVVREGPGEAYPEVERVPQGYRCAFTESHRDANGQVWYRITVKGRDCWAPAYSTEVIAETQPTRTPRPTANLRAAGLPSVRILFDTELRTGPGEDIYPAVETAMKGEEYLYVETREDAQGTPWYCVQMDNGDRLWVSARYAVTVAPDETPTPKPTKAPTPKPTKAPTPKPTRTPTPEPTEEAWDLGNDWQEPAATPVSGPYYVRIVGTTIKIRSTPGLGNDVILTPSDGARYEYLGDYSLDGRGVAFYHISTPGGNGYVTSAHSIIVDGSGQYAEAMNFTGNALYSETDSTYIRSSQSTSSAALGQIPAGAYADYIGPTVVQSDGLRWFYVSYQGVKGWVLSRAGCLARR